MSPCDPVLRMTDVSAGYANVLVVEHIGIEVGAGELVYLVGGNGSGKSTIMRAILGLCDNYIGKISVLGRDANVPRRASVLGQSIGVVLQGHHVWPNLSAGDNIELPLLPLNRARRDECREMLAPLSPLLDPIWERPAALLSGGERQLVAVARALVVRPRLLLLDEPTAGLNAHVAEAVCSLVQHCSDTFNTGVILSAHLSSAPPLSFDRIYILRAGKIVDTGAGIEFGFTERHGYTRVCRG